ncbi:MAG TPA: protein kinase [Myxococcaceae bacterium]|nr:protein kinase [Myxococcaceae bacterium]
MLLLGRYQLLRQIGRGGMAEVWEAHALGDRGFTRRVAVKRLTERGPEMERMFVDEARIASRLHHANIVAVLDFGVAEGVPFQVLEFVDGLDAEALRARAGGIPVGCALHVAAEVARGLDHAHRARGEDGEPLGIVHRDVSPNNVLVAWTGEVKLGDFGIAFARDRGGATQAGTTKGKPSYMAPEQITRGTLDARTDLFALGCTLHALIVGASPLSGEDRMADLLAGKPLPLSPDLPEDVRAIVARATQRSRSERFEDAGRFASACDETARAHASGDPRRVFMDWLGGLRPAPGGAPPAGSLDWLLGAAPAPAPQESPSARGATTPGAAMGAAPTDTMSGAPASAMRAAPTNPGNERLATEPITTPGREAAHTTGRVNVPAGSPARRSRIAIASGAVALAITGGAAVLMTRPVEDPPLQPVSFTALPIPPAASPLPEPPAAPAPTRPRPRAPTPTGTGFLQVSGEMALRKEIFVDGKSAGFAPKTLELAVGPHQLSLHGEDGAVIGSHRVEITPFQTRSAPARWMPDSGEK